MLPANTIGLSAVVTFKRNLLLTNGAWVLVVFLLASAFLSADAVGEKLQKASPVIERWADNCLWEDIDTITADESENESNGQCDCNYSGGSVLFSHPNSLYPTNKYFPLAQLILRSFEMMVDEINAYPRCGINVGGQKYSLALKTYADESSPDRVELVAKRGMVSDFNRASTTKKGHGAEDASRAHSANFWLGPYSTPLTKPLSPIADSTGAVLVAGVASPTVVYAGYPTVFGTLPPSNTYFTQAVEAVANAGARTVASVYEPAAMTRAACLPLSALVEKYGLRLLSEKETNETPTEEELESIAREFANMEEGEGPDVVFNCMYEAACIDWIKSLRKVGWSPKAQVLQICVGMDSIVDAVGYDARYMMGSSSWHKSIKARDNVIGWTANEYATKFHDSFARHAVYQAASSAGALSTLVQAVEKANSFDTANVTQVLTEGEFETLYGTVSFDDNGQNKAPYFVLQYDRDSEVQTVFPPALASAELLYPMPKFDHKDCLWASLCQLDASLPNTPGTCNANGTCKCSNDYDTSIGMGVEARCTTTPAEENMTYVSKAWRILGITMVAIQGFLSLLFSMWTWYFRERSVVKKSQPTFLLLIAFGCFVISSAIIPIGFQFGYRYKRDPITKELITDEPMDGIRGADAACMAFPWLFGLGFVIVFSALFAKIWRVKKIFALSASLVRKSVTIKDVVHTMVFMLLIEACILLCWQIVDPLRWTRTVVSRNFLGFPEQSIGYCTNKNLAPFLVPMVAFNGGCLVYALYLCYITRSHPSDLSEGKWITASVLSIFQICLLGIPILVIFSRDTNAFYFVRAAVMFLMSSTVTLLIFVPKVYELHTKSARNAGRHGEERRRRYNFSQRFNLSPETVTSRDNSKLSVVDSVSTNICANDSSVAATTTTASDSNTAVPNSTLQDLEAGSRTEEKKKAKRVSFRDNRSDGSGDGSWEDNEEKKTGE